MGISAFDQVDLPFTQVVLQRLLALDGLADVGELLVPDEHVHTVFAREADPLPARCCSTRKISLLVTPMYSVPRGLLARM